MLTVSESACELIGQLLIEVQATEGFVVRIVPGETGLFLAIDQIHPGDATYEHEGKPVLAVSQILADLLEDQTLDVQDTPSGRELTLVPTLETDGEPELESE
ncbi:MAG: HesB/YadR/YfhF-family protein [Planctomycetes bacterium]|nr:HesB/YadR/YfhF-family protein [Planctomycetota bacterium]